MMSDNGKTSRSELDRIKRVSDMMCSMHFALKDRFTSQALMLDIVILIVSTWLLAMLFVDSNIAQKLSPSWIDSKIWLGLLAVTNFCLSIIQLRVNWKEMSEAHERAGNHYAFIKIEASALLGEDSEVNPDKCNKMLALYNEAGNICIKIPQKKFLELKKQHKLKVLMSRYLDKRPGVSLRLLQLRLWFRDNGKLLQGIEDTIESSKDAKDRQ